MYNSVEFRVKIAKNKAYGVSKLAIFALLLLLLLGILLQSNSIGSSNRRRLISAVISRAKRSIRRLLLSVSLVSPRWGVVAWRSRRWSYSGDPRGCTRDSGCGCRRRCTRSADLLDMVGWEETLTTTALSCPPVCVGFVYNFNDFPR